MDKQLVLWLAVGSALVSCVPAGVGDDAGVIVDAGFTAPVVDELEVAVGGVTLVARTATPTPTIGTVVIASGGPGLSHHYTAGLDRLAERGWRVVSYDQRGTGGSSEPSPADYSPAAHVDDLDAVRQALGEDQIWLLGHSWGGFIAHHYAFVWPEHLSKLTLVGSMPPTGAESQEGSARLNERIAQLQALGKIQDPLPSDPEEMQRAVLPAYFSDPDFELPPELLATQYDAEVGAATRTACRLSSYDQRAELANVALDVGVFMGADDPFGLDWATSLASALSSATTTVTELPACGHVPWMECPEPFYDAL